ncbi:MAG: hypothetical protein KDK39_17455, partial [Leptospiraceae bacterium]|nr:hypothetical protein [Leptospiraceae bacterium]
MSINRQSGAVVQSIVYVLFLFFYFCGLGSFLSSLSPWLTLAYGQEAHQLLFAGQIAYPAGYLLAGSLSDSTQRIRLFLWIGLGALPVFQAVLFTPHTPWPLALGAAFGSRFFLAANLQLLSIAILESMGNSSFARLRSAGTFGFGLIQLSLWLFSMQYEANPEHSR